MTSAVITAAKIPVPDKQPRRFVRMFELLQERGVIQRRADVNKRRNE